MASWVYILPDDNNPLVVTFDTTISETHEQSAEITKHPVEDAPDVADHIRPLPPPFSCEVFVSNTPIDDLGGRGSVQTIDLSDTVKPLKIEALSFAEEFDRVKEVYSSLRELSERGATMSVVTSLRTYERMALALVSTPRTEDGGASFNLTFEPIQTVTTSTVAAPKPLEPRGAPNQNKGGQAAKPANPKDAAKGSSLAFKALSSLGVVSP